MSGCFIKWRTGNQYEYELPAETKENIVNNCSPKLEEYSAVINEMAQEAEQKLAI